MRYLLLALILVSPTIWADDKKPEAPKADAAKAATPPGPITVVATPPPPAKLAEIDPTTLKVTYAKGSRVTISEVKQFADEMVKAWAQTQTALGQCQQALQVAVPPKEEKKK